MYGGRVIIFQKLELSKIYRFLVWVLLYKTQQNRLHCIDINEILNTNSKILLKHKVNDILYFGVKNVVFEDLKWCH